MSYGLKVKNQAGVVLILTFIFMVTLIVITAAYLFMITGSMRNLNAQTNNSSAFYLAEAGLNKAVWYLMNAAPDSSTDGSWRTTAYPANFGPNPTDPQQESLGDGTYTMWVETSGGNVLISARGTMNNIQRTVQQEINLSNTVPEAFNHAIYAGGSIITAGSSGLSVTGDQQAGVTNFPTANFSYYQSVADSGQDISANYTFSTGTYSGIWYIDGNVTIANNVTINGSIITTGRITMSNKSSISITATSSYPALIVNDNITASNSDNITINGLIYAGVDSSGEFNLRNSDTVSITGTIITANNLNLRGSSAVTITYDGSILTDPPLGFSSGVVSVADSWKEI